MGVTSLDKVSKTLKDLIPLVEALESPTPLIGLNPHDHGPARFPLFGFSICVDAGHGGRDPGAVDGFEVTQQDKINTYEKYLNLELALTVGKMLEVIGATVVYTRKTDVDQCDGGPYVSAKELGRRCKISDAAKCSLFLSIHHNYVSNPEAHGTETFVYKKGGKAEIFAESIQRCMIKATGLTDRGVKEGNFAVLRETDAPAVLVEVAFISNAQEEILANQPDWRMKVAQAIVDGVMKGR